MRECFVCDLPIPRDPYGHHACGYAHFIDGLKKYGYDIYNLLCDTCKEGLDEKCELCTEGNDD